MSVTGTTIQLEINGVAVSVDNVPIDTGMTDFLREYLNMTGTRWSCRQAVCRSCTIIIDNPDGTSETSLTCVMPAITFIGKKIRTIEGAARENADSPVAGLSRVQEAFLKNFAFQCGYCTPGFVNEATVLLEKLTRDPINRDQVEKTITEALDPHLCRCTGYVRYYAAIKELILATPELLKP